ncbi:MAG: hypothetical protein LBG96_08325 [Tannerella sp.]|jgi:hypothetical protein|nr:hypothetical protein [Tannerella sp.]
MRQLLYILIGCIAFTACSKDDGTEETPAISRTIIVYMAADNDLSGDALIDLEEMKQGFMETDVNLVVFSDLPGELPRIMKISPESATEVHTYPEFNSTEPSQMRQILNNIISMYPADEYGLILWSHGTSWLPAGVRLKSFGEDAGKQMDIQALAEALPIRFDFILFDACLMGSVEVAYELKYKTDYLIASSTETVYEGFPYDLIVPELLKPDINSMLIAETYFNYYNSLPGAYCSATVSVTDCKELERLAELTRQLLSGGTYDLSVFDRTAVQRLDVYSEQYTFDFLDFINKLLPYADKSLFIRQLDRTVLYKANTRRFLEEYDIETYCGLSCYIPHPNRDDLNEYYKTLGWYAVSGFNFLF